MPGAEGGSGLAVIAAPQDQGFTVTGGTHYVFAFEGVDLDWWVFKTSGDFVLTETP